MLIFLRLLALLGTPLLFGAVWFAMPEVLAPDTLKWLMGIIVVLWALEFYFFQKLGDVSEVTGLSMRERERLNDRLSFVRGRVWWIGVIEIVCALLIWLMVAMGLPISSPWYAAAAGLLFGVSLSYLALIPGWLNETHRFIDAARAKEQERLLREQSLKALDDD